MKNLSILLLAVVTLVSCAKKTYTGTASSSSTNSTQSLNTTSNTSATLTDNSIVIKTKRYDTTFTIGGDTLVGIINSGKSRYAQYENKHLRLNLKSDSTGLVTATVISKLNPLTIKVDETTTSYNNVSKTTAIKAVTKLEAGLKRDSLTTFKTKLVEPQSISVSLKYTLMIMVLMLVIAAAFYLTTTLKKE